MKVIGVLHLKLSAFINTDYLNHHIFYYVPLLFMRCTVICDGMCALDVDMVIGGGHDKKSKKCYGRMLNLTMDTVDCFTTYVVKQTRKQLCNYY